MVVAGVLCRCMSPSRGELVQHGARRLLTLNFLPCVAVALSLSAQEPVASITPSIEKAGVERMTLSISHTLSALQAMTMWGESTLSALVRH